jgi:hypothetical protein
MKIKVVENGYYVSEDLTNLGMVSQEEFEGSFVHSLVVGDVWMRDEYEDGHEYFKCVSGKWCDEESDGWWEYKGNEGYFEVIEE